MLRLRERLIRVQGPRSILDYLNDIKGATNELALIEHPVSDDDLSLYIINGLSTGIKDISAAF